MMIEERRSLIGKEVGKLPQGIKVEYPYLAKEIYEISRENIYLCYECQKCSSGCPMSSDMDHPPSFLTHLIRLGLLEEVLRTNTFWLCLSCMTCTSRCPQGLDIAKVMDSLKMIAQKKGIAPTERKIASFYKSMIGSISTFGRVYELGMIMMLKLRTGDIFSDTDLGIKMVKNKKLKLLPSFGDRRRVKKVIKGINKIKEGD